MRFLRPRSLTGLMLIGFALVSIPLLIAVITATAKVRRLADESTQLVHTSVDTTHNTQLLFQQIATMERSVRLYQVLKDGSMLTGYRQTRDQFLATLKQIDLPEVDVRRSAHLTTLRTLQSKLDEVLLANKPPTDAEIATLLPLITQLLSATAAFGEYTGARIDSGLSQLQAATTDTQQYLMGLSVVMTLLTATLVLLFTKRLMQPIRQIDSAINQLGKGMFARGIEVTGPSDLVALGHQLEWLRTRLLELAQERNRFLRHMSHELKTPLAAIREGAELLTDGAVGELDPHQREVISILRDNSIRLQQLIENLLSFSAWQARHTGLEITEFHLRPLIKSALETHQLTLLAQRVQLDLKVQDVELRADRAKLKLILDNLLSNALKYSPRGGTIFIHAKSAGEHLILDVADTGLGIDKDERAAIFDAFYSGRAPQAGHLKGTGIGLSVVLEFVQAHGGSIEIMDNIFPGAHFRVRLPLAPSGEGVTA
jgi:two-component system sensor histidine kinase GlrK